VKSTLTVRVTSGSAKQKDVELEHTVTDPDLDMKKLLQAYGDRSNWSSVGNLVSLNLNPACVSTIARSKIRFLLTKIPVLDRVGSFDVNFHRLPYAYRTRSPGVWTDLARGCDG